MDQNTKKNQEAYVYAEGYNGMTARVPESQLEEWQARQEALKQGKKSPDSEAARKLQALEDTLSAVGTETLQKRGLSYAARAEVRREYFPVRVYGEYTLPAGEYLALIVELGRAEGQNWWCVVYPPLCFAGQAGVPVRYKSRIAELIAAWQANRRAG